MLLKLSFVAAEKSPLVSASLSSRFRSLRFVVCVTLAVFFITESVYLSYFSKIFTESLLVFYVSHAVISIAVYCFTWSLPLFDHFYILSDCSINGISRRDAISHSIFEWCSLQSILLYSSFLAAYLWLLLLYFNTICPPCVIALYCSPRALKFVTRPFLMLSVYGVSVTISSLTMSSLRENDGVSGVCHNGLRTLWKYSISIFPVVCLFLLILSFGVLVVLRKKDFLEFMASKHAMLALDKKGDERLNLNEEKSCGDNVALASEFETRTANGSINLAQISSNCAMEEILQRRFHLKYKASYSYLSKLFAHERNYGVSSLWTGVSFGFFTIFLIGSPAIHSLYVGVSAQYEIKSVVEYINCGSAHALWNRSLDWSTFNNFSLTALREAPWCSLPIKQAQERLGGVMMVFIILPVLPFLVLLVAFLVAVSGYGGLSKVRSRAVDSNTLPKFIAGEHESCELVLVKCAPDDNPEMNEGRIHDLDSVPAQVVTSSKREDEKTESVKVVGEAVDIGQPTEDERSSAAIDGDREQQDEYHEELLNIIGQLRGELAFQQSMLVNDGAAWSICLHYMQRTKQFLSTLKTAINPASVFTQDLCALGEEVSHALSSVSDHAMQLSRWMNSVQEAYIKIEQIERGSHEKCPSFFGSQDIERQEQLLALNEYLLRTVASPVHPRGTSYERLENRRENSALKNIQNISKQEYTVLRTIPETLMKHEELAHEQNQQCDHQPGPSRKEENIIEASTAPSTNTDPSGNENGTICQQLGGPRQLLRISAYAESYCATPRGIMTRLTVPELRIRIQQIKNICAGDSLYPQELSYMLLVTGDIASGGNKPCEDLFLYSMEQLPRIFGANVPSIDARIGVQDFLSQMRRRALCVVAAIGYHFLLRSRRGPEYTPPVLPPLGLYRSENELVLRRVLGDRDDVLPSLREFLQEFQFGRGPVLPRLDLKFVSAFRNYLCLVAAREGFSNDNEEYVPDPPPPPEPLTRFEEVNSSSGSDEENMGPVAPS